MPEEASDQTERLLGRQETKAPYEWTEEEEEEGEQNGADGNDIDDEEQAQWNPTARLSSGWHKRWQSVGRLAAPVLAVLTTLAVVAALFLLLVNNGGLPHVPTASADTSGSTDPGPRPGTPERDPIIILHPENHISREARVIHLAWNVTKARRAPDGVFRDVILINGQFPGPTIEARTGDTLVVAVTNAMDEGLSLHWHGLHMRGANHMDGPVGVNQCAIPSGGGTFVYEVPTGDQAGTFWYHSHSELQRADGLYGALVIHAPASKGAANSAASPDAATRYDKELLLMIGDWYHFSGKTMYAVFEDPTSNGNEPCPGSVLINGMGAYDCSRAAPAAPVDCHAVAMPWLVLDKTLRYRVRLINVGTLTGISTTVPDGMIEALTVDGGLPVVVSTESTGANSAGVVYPAQRVDYILSWPAATAHTDTELVITVDGEYYVGNLLDPPSQSVRIASAHPASEGVVAKADNPTTTETVAIDLRRVKGRPLATPLPEPDNLYMIFAVVEILSHNRFVPHGYINHTMWIPQDLPLLSLDRSAWDDHQLVPWTGSEPVWVELTINNIDTQGHPFHLHGFDFYVVAAYEGLGGWDYYNPFFTPWKPPRGGPMNLEDPPQRDTVYVPPYGYVILRFRADNEGIWVLHCHILWHQASGMTMAFQVLGSSAHGLGGTPASFRAAEYCRTSKSVAAAAAAAAVG